MSDHTLNQHANQEVTVSITSPSSTDSRDDGYVNLRVQDRPSGTVLVDVEIPAGRFYRLLQGADQHWPAVVSSNLERVGKRLETLCVDMPDHRDRNDEPEERDIYRVVDALHPDWLNYDETRARFTNHGWEAIVRRWVVTDDE